MGVVTVGDVRNVSPRVRNSGGVPPEVATFKEKKSEYLPEFSDFPKFPK